MVNRRIGLRKASHPCLSTLWKVITASFTLLPCFFARLCISSISCSFFSSNSLLLISLPTPKSEFPVVPTTYRESDGTIISTNQFSVTEYSQGIRLHSINARGVPGMYFFFVHVLVRFLLFTFQASSSCTISPPSWLTTNLPQSPFSISSRTYAPSSVVCSQSFHWLTRSFIPVHIPIILSSHPLSYSQVFARWERKWRLENNIEVVAMVEAELMS